MSQTKVPFAKMNGLGNDFVIVDARANAVRPKPEIIAALANRETGIGFDQFITIEPAANGGDAFMRIDNADGGEVEACGNATRCVARILSAESGKDGIRIETRGGTLQSVPDADPDSVTIDMGSPRFGWEEIPLSEEFADTRYVELQVGPIDDPVLHSPSVVNVGNPHAIFWLDDVDAHDLARFGPMLEHHPLFPDRANISIAEVRAEDSIKVRTWERGVGLTRACGTGACATLVCAARTGRAGRQATVTLPGGDLLIRWTDADRILMTGPVEHDFTGAFDPATGAFTLDERST